MRLPKCDQKNSQACFLLSFELVCTVCTDDKESGDKIGLAAQRHLINNFKLAAESGAEVIRVTNNNIARGIIETAEERKITTICIGKPHLSLMKSS